MGERFGKMKKSRDGFTLVELIVVLVILAILIGMLVPSLTGYIDKANEKTALLECRQVVLAGQVEASGQYGKGITEVPFDKEAIKKMAEVKGTIDSIQAADGKITYVKYISVKGIVVIYENGEYRIDGKGEGTGGSGGGGTEPGGGENPGGGGSETGNGVVVKGTDGNTYTIAANSSVADLKKNASTSTGIWIGEGKTFQDETGFYAIKSTSGIYLQNYEFTNLAELAGGNPDIFQKISADTMIFVENDFSEGYWTGTPPNQGDVCHYRGEYYVSQGKIGKWDIPGQSRNWVKI